jgi:ABC-type Mn2+/Zn2+ transport system ATPase subunit
MKHRVSIERIGTSEPLRLTISEGEVLFIVGPNGSGKSSLVNVLASNFRDTARVSWAHRKNIVYDSTNSVTARERLQITELVRSWDIDRQARFWDNYSDRRPGVALFDLINASDVLSRKVAEAARADDRGALTALTAQPDPIDRLNHILKAAALPIVLRVSDTQELQAKKRDSAWFPAGELSDGERSATLLAADILGAPHRTLFLIDEPERHLHRSIAAPLLKELFASRPDCTFVITTHDLSLVLEHAGRRVLLLRDCVFDKGGGARWDLDVLEPNAPIEDELKRTILGSRSALLFVEGDTRSLDMGLYRILFPDITVEARGGCRDVVATVRSLRAIEPLHWLKAFGIVDRDGRSEDEIVTCPVSSDHG